MCRRHIAARAMDYLRPLYAAVLCSFALSLVPSAVHAGQADSARLPALVLDSLPLPVRSSLDRAHRHAEAHPDDGDAIGALGMLLHAYEQHRSASACYDIARRLQPDSLSWSYLSGVVQAELGEHALASASFQQALKIDPGYLPARLRLADALMWAGDLNASRAEYAALVKEFPELASAHYGLGRVASAVGAASEAVGHYQRAVEAAPQFGMAHYALALAYRDIGQSDRSRLHHETYQKLGARRPVPSDPLLDQMRALRETARDLIAAAAQLGRAGRSAEAIATLLRALEQDPSAAQAHVNLIALYGRADQPGKAEEHYQAALRLDSSLADAHYNYGVLLHAMRRHDDAAEAFRRSLDVNPFHAQAHNNLASLLAGQGRLEAAAAHYRQALANDPQHRTARFNLGRVLLGLRRPREAIDHLEKVLVPDNSDTPRYMLALATAWVAAGDVARAREYAEGALRRAQRLEQKELAAAIVRELQRIAALQ